MRRFLRGDEDQVNGFLYYTRENPQDHGEIHYLANHDGFTLVDMTSYDTRHNMENGEENRDGSAYNYSWNCGVEGSDTKDIDSGTSETPDEKCIAFVVSVTGNAAVIRW